MIHIREAQCDDVPGIAHVHIRSDWDTYSPLFGSSAYALLPGESEARWRRALHDGDTLLVATDGGAIVGLGREGIALAPFTCCVPINAKVSAARC